MNALGFAVLPMRTGRGLNDRLHPRTKAKRTAKERKAVGQMALVALSPRDWPRTKLRALLVDHRFVVLLIRCTPSHVPLDDDNLRGSLKATRDAIADRLGVDDGDRRCIRFEYTQRTSVPWGVEFSVRLEVRGA